MRNIGCLVTGTNFTTEDTEDTENWKERASETPAVHQTGQYPLDPLRFLLAGQDAFELGDDAEHDFVGAAADGEQARVSISAGDARLLHVAHAAVVLQAAIGDLAGKASGFELGHRGEARHIFARDHLLGGTVAERLERFDLGKQLAETEVDDLIV